jgi:hypothetical protein
MSTDLSRVVPAVHLVASSELFGKGYGARTFVAMCGLMISGPTDEDVDHPGYCLTWVNAAVRSYALGMPTRDTGGGAQ